MTVKKTIKDRAYRILKTLYDEERTTTELRAEIGWDPHPEIGRLWGRGWVLPFDGVWHLTTVGRAALDLGYEERVHAANTSREGQNGVPNSVWSRMTEEERKVQMALDERAQLAREYTGGER